MTGPEQSEQFLEPPLPIEVAELVATHPDYDHEKRWKALGSDDASTVRKALGIAEQLRQEHVDPGDAFLQGLSYAEAVRRETKDRTQFIEEMEARADQKPDLSVSEPSDTDRDQKNERQKPRRLRTIFRSASAALIILSMTHTSRGGDDGV